MRTHKGLLGWGTPPMNARRGDLAQSYPLTPVFKCSAILIALWAFLSFLVYITYKMYACFILQAYNDYTLKYERGRDYVDDGRNVELCVCVVCALAKVSVKSLRQNANRSMSGNGDV